MENQTQKLVEHFNEKYIGKEINSCQALSIKRLILSNGFIHYCCDNPTVGKSCHPFFAQIFRDTVININKDSYIQKYIQIVEENQSNPTDCKDCPHLLKRAFEPLDYENFKLGAVSFTTFHRCNMKCVYCRVGGAIELYYDAFGVGEDILNQDLIGENTNVIFSSGEPTIHPKFSEMVKRITSITAELWILTNAVICSEEVITALKNKKAHVNISVDSGTRLVYQKVKGKDEFDAVWHTIKRYCEVSEEIYVKYIVFSYNSEKEELDAFINNCVACGVKNIMVSPEQSSALFEYSDLDWSFGEKELAACAYLIEKAYLNNLKVTVAFSLFTEAQRLQIFESVISTGITTELEVNLATILFESSKKRKIMHLLFYKFLAAYIEDIWPKESTDIQSVKLTICIFGNGIIGNAIKQVLIPFCKENNYELILCDNNADKHIESNGIKCLSVEEATALNKVMILIPKDCKYMQAAIKQLEEQNFKNYRLCKESLL